MNGNFFRSMRAILFAACGALLLAACGSGDSPPPEERSSVVIGKVSVATGVVKAGGGDTQLLLTGDPIEVQVLEAPEIRTTVAADGTFTLRGLPAGSFTLVFTQLGVEVGRLTFQEVAPNQQITIEVQLADDEVVLVDEDRRGIGHAGVEIEGLVQNVVVLSLTGESRFVIAGRQVIARPGVTAIREGITRKTVADVTVGRQVHVKGTMEGSIDVLAYEIKLQSPEDDDGEGGGGGEAGEGKVTICHIPPGNPSKAKTITIGESAWPAHQRHGDTEGPCPT